MNAFIIKALWVSAFVLIVVAMGAVLTEGRWLSALEFSFGGPGTGDFIQYWSAFQAVMADENPYDIASVMQFRESAVADFAGTDSFPVVMFNPPWLLVLLGPVLWPSFQYAAAAWFSANIALFVGTGLWAWRSLIRASVDWAPLAVGIVFFLPAWGTLWSGQISLLLAFAVAGLYWALATRREVWAGIFLVIMTLKPHLFYLLGIALAYDMVVRRRWLMATTFFAVLGLLVALVYMASPMLMSQWLGRFDTAVDAGVNYSALDYLPSCLPTIVRLNIFHTTGELPVWPMVAIPLITAAAVGMMLMLWGSRLDWRRHFVPLLCLSLFTNPYGWLWDYSVLLVAQGVMVAQSVRPGAPFQQALRVLFILALIQCAMILQTLTRFSDHAYFFWLPLAFFGVWVWWLRGGVPPAQTQP